MNPFKITLMPLNYNGIDLLKLAIPKLVEASEVSIHDVEVVVVDNNSHDDSEIWLKENYPNVRFLAYKENKILTTYNDAIKHCKSPYVMILNNDVIVDKGFIDPLVKRMESEPTCFGVSPSIQADLVHEVWDERLSGRFFHGHLAGVKLGKEPGGTLYCHGAATLVRRDRFLELGGFDPLFFYQEDNDLSYRAWRAGYSCLFEPSVHVHHMGSQTVLKDKDGLEKKRGYKERANNYFVIKNVQNFRWKINFKFWTVMKLVKMLLSFDSKRFFAFKETVKRMKLLKKSHHQQIKLDDEVLLERIVNFKLPEIAEL